MFDVLNRDTRRNCNELLVTATLIKMFSTLFNDSLIIGNCGGRQVSCSERCLVGVKQVVSFEKWKNFKRQYITSTLTL